MSGEAYTFCNVPNGSMTRLEISEATARAIVAEYSAAGWRVCQMGRVVVLHSQDGEFKQQTIKPGKPLCRFVERTHHEEVLSYIAKKLEQEIEEFSGDAIPKVYMANLKADVIEWLESSQEFSNRGEKA